MIAPTADAGIELADGGAMLDAAVGAPPAILTCNGTTCAPAEFCATLPAADPGSGDAGQGDEGDGGAAEGDATLGTGDAWGGVQATPLHECRSAVFANICDNPVGTLYFDAYDPDNAAAVSLGASLASACHMTIASPDAGPADPTSGEPLTGIGNLCILAGGAYGHPPTGYLDNHSLTDVVLLGANDDAGAYDLRFTQENGLGAPRNLVLAPFLQPPNTDYFLVELAADPGSGSLCLDVLGMSAQGTTAGAYYVANQFFGNNAYKSSAKSWYVYYWSGVDATGVPGMSDTFTLVASGGP